MAFLPLTGERDEGMVEEGGRWWERLELEIQLIALAISLVMLALGVLLPNIVLVGAGFLGTVFSLTYAAYAYVRRFW